MKNLTWQNPEQLFVAQVLINKVKSKCCGIKEWRTKLRQKCEKWESLGVNNAKIRGKSIKKSPQQSCLPPISQIPTDFLPLKVTQIFYFCTFKSHADFADDADFLPFYSFTFLPLNSSFTFKSPQAVPSRKIWRGLWCPANLRAKRFWAPEGGYIPYLSSG